MAEEHIHIYPWMVHHIIFWRLVLYLTDPCKNLSLFPIIEPCLLVQHDGTPSPISWTKLMMQRDVHVYLIGLSFIWHPIREHWKPFCSQINHFQFVMLYPGEEYHSQVWAHFDLFLKIIYLFIFVCAGSPVPCRLFCSCGECRLLSSCDTWVSHCASFSCCRAGALEKRPDSCDLVAPGHVGSSQIRDWTRVSWISRQILFHCTTREAPILMFMETYDDPSHICSLISVGTISEKTESHFRVRAQILDHQLSILKSLLCSRVLHTH